jgi:hypothetical protein
MSKRRRQDLFRAGCLAAWTLAVLPATANAARTISVRDEGSLGFKSSSGSQIIDEGRAKGTLPGWVKVRLTYNGNPTVYAQFTIYTKGGSINGHATGRVSNPNSMNPSFRGLLTITGGSGRYAHAGGSGELFGVFYRRSFALTVQAIGKLRY